jgi:hypothetical protein
MAEQLRGPFEKFVDSPDGLFFDVLPLASDEPLTTFHPLPENVADRFPQASGG